MASISKLVELALPFCAAKILETNLCICYFCMHMLPNIFSKTRSELSDLLEKDRITALPTACAINHLAFRICGSREKLIRH